MPRNTISSCHSLRIIPISGLSQFARMKSRVIMSTIDGEEDAMAVPGSIKVSTSSDNGIIKKKITFERSDVSDGTADLLEEYKVSRLIATYVDESGKRRVAGSPDWPLSLDYSIGDGVFSVTLQGEDTAPDAFLMD